jgi:MinD-like ATPase involved in chromosome partitioning or flagellar assembly
MAVGYPLIVVVGSKGGVGTTTIATGLLQTVQAQKMPVVGADLTATNDMTRVLDQRAVAISSLVRHRGRMPALIGKALRRRMALLALDLEATMYSDRLSEMLRILVTRRPVIVDAGSAFATTGARPLAPYLSLATRIVLVLIPDIRSVMRTERLLQNWTAHEQRILLVENRAGEAPSVAGAKSIPMASTGSLGRLMKEPAGDAIRVLAAELLPQQEVDIKVAGGDQSSNRGIIRSFLSNRQSAGS